MDRSEINKLKKAVLSGRSLSDICKEEQYDVNSVRRMLKKEGIDYHQIVAQRKAKRNEIEFAECLKMARKSGLIPSGIEFKSLGIPKGRIGIYVKKLKDMGFMQKFINDSKISDDELLEELYKIYKKIGVLPENRHITMHSKYSNTSYYNHFGSLANAIILMFERYGETKKKSGTSQ